MSGPPGVEVVVDELVLDGVGADVVPLLVRAMEVALAAAPEIGADEVAGVVAAAVADALRRGGGR